MKVIRDKVTVAAARAWSATKAKTQGASGETKATTAGAAAGGIAATTVGSHMGIAAFGTAVSGAALLPVVITVGVGAVAGFAAFKLYQDVRAKRTPPSTKGAARDADGDEK